MMDISDTLTPKSDQLDAVDLHASGPRTFTITEVSRGNADQPVQVGLAEFDRVWRPSKGMRRVLAACWGPDAKAWTGRRIRLFCDPDVRFGSEIVGGVRISHMSHISEKRNVPMIVKRGKSGTYTVEPLAESKAELNIAACESIPELREAWKYADPTGKKLIEARVKALETAALDEKAGA